MTTDKRIAALEARLAAAEGRLTIAEAILSAEELRRAGYHVQPLPNTGPGQIPPYVPPGWPWYEVTCGGGTVQSDTAPAVTIKPLGPAA